MADAVHGRTMHMNNCSLARKSTSVSTLSQRCDFVARQTVPQRDAQFLRKHSTGSELLAVPAHILS
eukprot:579380-Pelagomonas_calceolata.AAC.7